MRNVEIKAKIRDLANLLLKAKALSDVPCENSVQHDTFYNVSNGRLKLRKFEDNSSELIFYKRDDKEGPKLSSYSKVTIPPDITDQINIVLGATHGTKCIVKKTRQLFMVGQTRIHIDSVQGLGDFMELEVTLKPDEQAKDGIKIAYSLMEQLGIHNDDLLAGAYGDMIEQSK